ncbi:protein GVQW3-like [Dermacentor variabilis]|uniref:protein GVQW3-like n=1 Tax=Dermacentor variabilis TaxID=34621 RepID=UPI003F5BAFD1
MIQQDRPELGENISTWDLPSPEEGPNNGLSLTVLRSVTVDCTTKLSFSFVVAVVSEWSDYKSRLDDIARKVAERLEQRYCIKFCQKLGDSQAETLRKIQTAFGDDAMSSTQIKKWYNRFKDGRTSVESEPRSGRPSTCRNDQIIGEVNSVVMRDRRFTIREIAEEVGISSFSTHSIMTEDVAMMRVSAKFVSKLLTAEQKQLRVEASQGMLDSTNSDPDFMNIIITGDESWVYGYDPQTKSQSSQWKHSTSQRP